MLPTWRARVQICEDALCSPCGPEFAISPPDGGRNPLLFGFRVAHLIMARGDIRPTGPARADLTGLSCRRPATCGETRRGDSGGDAAWPRGPGAAGGE